MTGQIGVVHFDGVDKGRHRGPARLLQFLLLFDDLGDVAGDGDDADHIPIIVAQGDLRNGEETFFRKDLELFVGDRDTACGQHLFVGHA